jgi:hypothetical protein
MAGRQSFFARVFARIVAFPGVVALACRVLVVGIGSRAFAGLVLSLLLLHHCALDSSRCSSLREYREQRVVVVVIAIGDKVEQMVGLLLQELCNCPERMVLDDVRCKQDAVVLTAVVLYIKQFFQIWSRSAAKSAFDLYLWAFTLRKHVERSMGRSMSGGC